MESQNAASSLCLEPKQRRLPWQELGRTTHVGEHLAVKPNSCPAPSHAAAAAAGRTHLAHQLHAVKRTGLIRFY